MSAQPHGGANDGRHIGVAIGLPEPFNTELQHWRERLGVLKGALER